MSTQGFQLDPSIAGLDPALLKKRYDQLTPIERQQLGLVRLASDQEIAAAPQAPTGAPSDFSGPVIPNPNGIKVSEDTDPGGDATQLQDATFQKENYSGPTRVALASTGPQATTDAPSAGGGTVPVFSPDGQLGDIPSEHLPHALQAGAKPGVNIIAPDGTRGVVPADRYVEAVQHGAKVAPFEDQEIKHPGFWSMLGADLKNAIPHKNVNADDESWNAGRVGAAEHQKLEDDAKQAAADEWRKQHGYSGAYRATAPVAEGLGVNVPGMEQSAMEGDVGGVVGHAAAVPAQVAITEGLTRGAGAVLGSDTSSAIVRSSVKATNKALKKAPGLVGATIGGVAGTASHVPFGWEFGSGLGGLIGKEILPEIQIPGEHFGLPDRIEGGPSQAPTFVEKPPVTPSEAEPFEGVTSPQTEHAAGSESEAAPAETPESLKETPAQVLNKKASPADLEKALNDALGGKPLARNAPIAKRPGVVAVDTARTAALPGDYTPTPKSSVLAGYKYDPANETIHAITNSGQHYAHAGVSPEQFDAFEAAPSQGTAWNNLRKAPGVVQVEKNFQPSKPGTVKTETGEVIPKSKAGMISPDLEQKISNLKDFMKAPLAKAVATSAADSGVGAHPATEGDLTSLIQQSLDQVKAQKAAKAASALPEGTPRFVYRARDVGEQGVPLEARSHGQATSEPMQALKYAEPGQRGIEQGQVVRIDLSKLKPSDYVVKTHPDGQKWVRFTRPLSEDEVSHFAGPGQSTGKIQ